MRNVEQLREGLKAPERLLTCCARAQLGPEKRAERDRLLGRGCDWAEVLALAERHKLELLLYQNLKDAAAVPAEVNAELGRWFDANARRNLWLMGELLRIVKRLKNAGIECLPLKGLGLAVTVYGDISLRRFFDLDLLIRPEDFEEAVAALCEAGYQLEYRLTRAAQARYLREEHALSMKHPALGLTLEVHWRFTERVHAVPFRMEKVWGRSVPAAWVRGAFRELAPEDLFLYLAVHGAKHCWKRLEWICAAGEVMGNPAMNWEQVAAEARELGVARSAAAAVWLAHALLGTEIPEAARRVLPPYEAVAGAVERVTEFLFQPVRPWGAAHVAVQLSLRDRLADRMRMLALTMIRDPQAKDREALPLAAHMGFGLRLLRPFRLAVTQGWRLGRQWVLLHRGGESRAHNDSIRNREAEA